MIVTGIGSLPHADPVAAAEFVLATTDLPYLPQLPNRDPAEGMLAQWGDGMCGCGATLTGFVAGAPGPDGDPFGSAGVMLERASGDLSAIKTQATGPVTLAMAMVAGGHPEGTVWECVVPELVDRLSRHLGEVREAAPHAFVTVLLDEPGLTAFAPGTLTGRARDRVVESIGAVVHAVDHPVGVHCCGDADWELVANAGPAVISWDLAELGPGMTSSVDTLADAIATGTRISWGIVPSVAASLPDADDLVSRYRAVLAELVVAGAPLEPMREDAWLTPACGLVGLTVEQAERVMLRVRDVAEVIDDG